MKLFKAAAIAAFAIGCASALPAQAQTPAASGQCEFKKLGDMTVDLRHGVPRVAVFANGQRRWLQLNTATPLSMIYKSDVAALGGAGRADTHLVRKGRNGDTSLRRAQLKDVLLGDAVRLDAWDVILLDDEKQPSDVAGVIGADILAGPDIELDLGHNRIAFFSEANCAGASLAYWDGAIDQTDLYVPPPAAMFHRVMEPRVSVNGQPALAVVDTNSVVSAVDTEFSRRFGVKAGGADVNVITGYPMETLTARFESFAVGGEKILKPSLTIWKLYDPIDSQTGSNIRIDARDTASMILGLDFLKAHRVLVAKGQHKMYFSYNGGPVFTTLKSK